MGKKKEKKRILWQKANSAGEKKKEESRQSEMSYGKSDFIIQST